METYSLNFSSDFFLFYSILQILKQSRVLMPGREVFYYCTSTRFRCQALTSLQPFHHRPQKDCLPFLSMIPLFFKESSSFSLAGSAFPPSIINADISLACIYSVQPHIRPEQQNPKVVSFIIQPLKMNSSIPRFFLRSVHNFKLSNITDILSLCSKT